MHGICSEAQVATLVRTEFSVNWGVAFAVATLLFFSVTSAKAQPARVDLFVDDPRPVAKTVELLISRCPVVVTYEEPRYQYRGDIRDVTLEVR